MRIKLSDIGKKFNREWIFKDVNHTFESNSITAVHGANGSGKSTLLKIISGAELPNIGKLEFLNNNQEEIELNEVYQLISFVGPYMDLPELLTIREVYEFHKKFTPLQIAYPEFARKVFLEKEENKLIKNYSSGMRQRLKLGLSILGESPILILDEPCSNLDQKGIDLYQDLIKNNALNRIIIIGSNLDKNETFMATETVNIMNYK